MTKKILIRRPKRGHAAVDSITSSEEDHTSELDSENIDEVVALSKEDICKSNPNIWVLDTGASSPMTDQLHLFREGSFKSTPRVSIQVGGGRLYSDQRGTARVDAADGTYMYLNNVLYVPSLGVNSISANKLCKKGLQGSFDTKKI